MNSLTLALEGAWKVLLASLVLGAGLPALFAPGVRSHAYGSGGEAEMMHDTGGTPPTPRSIGIVVAWILFAVVLLAVLLGITFIVVSGSGKALSFEHVFPVIVNK
jgi:hypothetical protein